MRLIVAALDAARGNLSEAARLLDKVRVWVKHVAFTDPINFVVAAAVPGDRFTVAGENDLASGQSRNYLFEVISTQLSLTVTGSGQARFLVFGD